MEKPQEELDIKLCKQANQATIDLGKRALCSLFLLNGAAAAALLAQNIDSLKWAAFFFAFAALWAVAAMAIGHILCLFIVTSFYGYPIPVSFGSFYRRLVLLGKCTNELYRSDLDAWRIRLIIFSLGPAVLFIVGLLVSGALLGWEWAARPSA